MFMSEFFHKRVAGLQNWFNWFRVMEVLEPVGKTFFSILNKVEIRHYKGSDNNAPYQIRLVTKIFLCSKCSNLGNVVRCQSEEIVVL